MSSRIRAALSALLALPMLCGLAGAQSIGYQLQLYPEYRLERFQLPDTHLAEAIGTPAADEIFALAHDPVSGELLAATASGALGRLDPDTAGWTQIATIVGAGGTVTGLATLGGSAPLYLMTSDGGSSYLFTLDRSSGASQLVGTFSGRLYVDIAIDATGQLFAHCMLTDSLYRLSTTGMETLIGPTGIDANYAQGMDFDRGSGELYAWIYSNSVSATLFSRLDTSTGAATVLQTLAGEFEGVLTAPLTRIFADGFEDAP